jgi:rhodanese-related sulfurtransferase
MSLKPIDAKTLKRRLDEGSALLVDIREAGEYAAEHIAGARLAPLSRIDVEDFSAAHDRAAVFYCRSGARTRMNARVLSAKGFAEAYELTGGIMGWKAAGLPTEAGGQEGAAGGRRRFGWPF